MSISDIEDLLDAIKQHSDEEAQHWTKYTANWSRFRQIPYLNGVMISRRQARTRSVELFEDVLKNRKRRLASARGEGASDSSQAQSGWWKWLDRIKDELREEKELCHPDYEGLRKRGSEQKQLEVWRTKFDLRAKQSMAAMKLVLQFRAERRAVRMRLANDSWVRLMDPAFPKEVLILVIEAAVRCQAPCLSIELSSESLGGMANYIFARSQDILSYEDWGLPQQITARALLQQSIIKTTTGFTVGNTLRLPPVLEGRERFIRFLTLNVETMPRSGFHHLQLTRSAVAMQSTKSLLPNLETCVILYDFMHTDIDDFDLFYDNMTVANMLTISNVKKVNHVTTLKTAILESIAAFREYGPGRRKFVCFRHSNGDGINLPKGPLVRVDGDLHMSDGKSSAEDAAEEDNAAAKVVERIFEEAYWHDPDFRDDP